MADNRVSNFSFFINQQIQAQEKIESCLWKLEALINMAVTTDYFHDLSEIVLHNYFSIAEDLIGEAVKANQKFHQHLLFDKYYLHLINSNDGHFDFLLIF
jgi:hypothetical protein